MNSNSWPTSCWVENFPSQATSVSTLFICNKSSIYIGLWTTMLAVWHCNFCQQNNQTIRYPHRPIFPGLTSPYRLPCHQSILYTLQVYCHNSYHATYNISCLTFCLFICTVHILLNIVSNNFFNLILTIFCVMYKSPAFRMTGHFGDRYILFCLMFIYSGFIVQQCRLKLDSQTTYSVVNIRFNQNPFSSFSDEGWDGIMNRDVLYSMHLVYEMFVIEA